MGNVVLQYLSDMPKIAGNVAFWESRHPVESESCRECTQNRTLQISYQHFLEWPESVTEFGIRLASDYFIV